MTRNEFIRLSFGMGILGMTTGIKTFAENFQDKKDSEVKMPVLFMGHGNPMNAIEDNDFTRAWKKIGDGIQPKAILCISAHWLTKGTFVSVAERPETIYDFYGFPEQLFQTRYPSPGAPEVARQVKENVQKTQILEDEHWGLDHGTWSVLVKMYPKADIPVFQMSIDYTKPLQYHYELAQELNFLRSKGVLIIGSGNIVHNLRMARFGNNVQPYDWAIEFDETSKKLLLDGDHSSLINYKKLGKAAELSIPTEDHYIPLIYTLGLQTKNEILDFPVEGMAFGSGSMRSVKIG